MKDDPRGDVGVQELGQAMVYRLFSAGLDVHFALMQTGDGPVTDRLHHAVAELDGAIDSLRHLMVLVPARSTGSRSDLGPLS